MKKQKIFVLLMLLCILCSLKVNASSGRLAGDSIVNCNGIYYGKHGSSNPHWHIAEKRNNSWYPQGDAIFDTNPCATMNKPDTNSNSNTTLKENETSQNNTNSTNSTKVEESSSNKSNNNSTSKNNTSADKNNSTLSSQSNSNFSNNSEKENNENQQQKNEEIKEDQEDNKEQQQEQEEVNNTNKNEVETTSENKEKTKSIDEMFNEAPAATVMALIVTFGLIGLFIFACVKIIKLIIKLIKKIKNFRQ